ncbi:MAG TPA: hypothetical protein VMF30_19725 [Pirellulales bacterium]|nr:hypothetical protein [Pirellulales bacterium]
MALAIAGGVASPHVATAADSSAKSKPAAKADAAKTPAKKPAAPSLSGDLLDDGPAGDLDNQLLEGSSPAKPPKSAPPKRQPEASRPPAKTPGAPAQPPLDGAPPPVTEGPVLGANPRDPLFQIGEEMRAIERQLAAPGRSDAETQALQQKIVAQLAQLIAQLEQQQNSQQSGSQSKSQSSSAAKERQKVTQPNAAPSQAPATGDRAKESTERLGQAQARQATPEEIRSLMKDVWGQLPAREREQMLQSPPEQFLPKYELLLEKYYKRLADEQQRRP